MRKTTSEQHVGLDRKLECHTKWHSNASHFFSFFLLIFLQKHSIGSHKKASSLKKFTAENC